MKKLLSLIMCALLAFAAMPTALAVETGSENGFGYTVLDDGTAAITNYTGYDTSVDIPSEIAGKTVSTIGGSAFSYSNIESFTIPSSVTSIKRSAFEQSAFYQNSSNWENGILYIGDCLIDTSRNYTYGTLTVKDGTRLLADESLSSTHYSSFVLPNSLEYIGDYAIAWCEYFGTITIPSSVKQIGESAFFRCMKATEINVDPGNENFCSKDGVLFDKGMTTLLQYPLAKADTSYTVPSGVQTIAENSFWCSSLKSVTLPDSVETIGDGVFAYNKKLQDVSFGNGLKTIGKRAFEGCEVLISIVLPNSVKTIGSDAFSFCKKLESATLPNGLTAIDTYLFFCDRSLKSITIPNTVKSIDIRAFAYCDALTEVTVPSKVSSIKEDSFGFCKGLQKIIVESDNKYYSSQDGVLFNKDMTTLITYPGACALVDYTVPSSVKTIGRYSFNSSHIRSVKFNDGLETIDSNALAECNSLTGIAVPDSVKTINYGAFSNNAALTSAVIGSGVTLIGARTFNGCPELKSVTVYSDNAQLGEKPFGYITENYKDSKVDGLVLYCNEGSTAAKYAVDNEFEYRLLSNTPGDVNLDGIVNLDDVRVLISVIASGSTDSLSDIAKKNADTTNDGAANLADVRMLISSLASGDQPAVGGN